ncbi:MAG: hypothetical protein Q8Q06_01240 [bacterium]|nr:hypothetical protein [bacterium]
MFDYETKPPACPHECEEDHNEFIRIHIVACCDGVCIECLNYIKRDMMDKHLAECHDDPEAKKRLTCLSNISGRAVKI